MYEKFECIYHSGLNGIKENKTVENSSLFCENPAKDNKKNNCKMASKIGKPRDRIIEEG